MKKLNLLLSMLLIAGAVFVTSCNKDEDENGPTLDLKGGSGYTAVDATVMAGEDILVGINADAGDAELTKFTVTSTLNNIPSTVIDSTIDGNSFNMDIQLTFSAASVGANRLVFTVYDKNNNTAERVLNITVEDGATAVNKYSGIEFGSFNDQVGSFYNSDENIVYTVAQAKANQPKVDFLFYKGAQHANTLAAPDDADVNAEISTFQLNTWDTKNATRFLKNVITAAEFDAIVDEYNFPDFDDDNALSYADQLENGDVVYFKTVTGKLGFAKVVDLYSRGDRAEFDIIVQE